MTLNAGDSPLTDKTPNTSQESSEIVVTATRLPPIEKNVLNSYRSYTYNFTLATLNKEQVNNPSSYRNSNIVSNVILRSGGKAGTGITPPQPASADQLNAIDQQIIQNQQSAKVVTFNDAITNATLSGNTNSIDFTAQENAAVQLAAQNNAGLNQQLTLLKDGPQVVEDYNANSWAKFDYYIDNVEIQTIMAPTQKAQATIISGMSFEVYEPYSISGFLETLQVASVAAGYINYMQAVFVLEIKFIGYPDGDDFTDPHIVDKSTRFIPFHFTKVEVDVSEQGTRYRCQGVPVDQMAFGHPNNLQRPIQVPSSKEKEAPFNVKTVLENLMSSVTKGIGLDAKEGKYVEGTPTPTTNDEYKIEFPSYVDKKLDYTVENDIATAEVTKIFLQRNLYDFKDPELSKGSNYKFDDEEGANDSNTQVNPSSTIMVFQAGANISEIISSVIRDSDYLAKKLQKLADGGDIDSVIDNYDMIDFWRITIKVEIGAYDPVWGKNKRTFTYVVTPYKMHYTLIPGFQKDNSNPERLKSLIRRAYNYIYTGQNVDLLDFKLNFNTLFYEPLVRGMGNNDIVPRANALAPDEQVKAQKAAQKNLEDVIRKTIGQPVSLPEKLASRLNQKNAGLPKTDPFSIQAKNMFRSLIETSQFSMLMGDLEIIGDPFYLVTGGLGNYFPDESEDSPAETSDGETNHNYGQVLIQIDFKNPIDIDDVPFSDGGTGLAKFNTDKISFSGIYSVTRVTSMFKEGVFKQKLQVYRMISVDVNDQVTISNPGDNMKVSPNPNDALVPDAAKNIVKTPPASSISQLISGIQKIETSIQTAVSKIEGAISGAITSAGQAVSAVTAAPAAAIKNVTNSINGTIQGIASPITNAASQLGLTTAELLTLKPAQLASIIALSKLVPPNSGVIQQLQNGVVIQTPQDLQNLPAANPVTTAINEGLTFNGRVYTLEQIQKIRAAAAQNGTDIPGG
jgi:hypothetical protein